MSDLYFDDFQVGRRFSTGAATLTEDEIIAFARQRVVRVFEGGRIERTISTGGRDTYACMLGGDDRRTLFIRASSGTSPAMAKKSDGRIEFARVDAPGTGLP